MMGLIREETMFFDVFVRTLPEFFETRNMYAGSPSQRVSTQMGDRLWMGRGWSRPKLISARVLFLILYFLNIFAL